ncbi:hypothetical protein BU16DRAFT_529576 [Lophium mytilinum]|uniref:N-methyltransferase n=1 Tax=Lophium mytilinum TaxID=390894 RepID=A0A6A6QIF2_9PEZI|nr:hypothetical protein BU16DRAFT_529576 [Lophium mytilinum]
MAIDTALPGGAVSDLDVSIRNKLRSPAHPDLPQEIEILDIRRDTEKLDILQDIKQGLRPKSGSQKTLPTLLLYDEAGLRLFEKITYLDEYYLTNSEIEVLETYASQIADCIKPGSIVVELGSGNLRKVNILLQAIERVEKSVEYYALDLDLDELKRTFSAIPATGYKHVKCFGLHGTYDDGLEWLKSPHARGKAKTILWLGSSIGNFRRDEAQAFLKGYQNALEEGDLMLIGIDACKDSSRVYDAYNDKQEVTHHFILNGLVHASRILGQGNIFNLEDWKVIGEFNSTDDCHQAFLSPVRDVSVDGISIRKGERIRIEESHKYSADETSSLFRVTGLTREGKWSTKRGDYALHLVSKPRTMFPTNPKNYAAGPVPSQAEWDHLWKAWDAISRGMIPEEQLLSKPIQLRHPCIFYLGHIPTFQDVHLSLATDGPPTEPIYYRDIFERGIDPDVDDTTKCHPHSKVPDTWPDLDDVLKFQESVRARVRSITKSEAARHDGRVARSLWFTFEHEAMHVETLLYMLLQSENTTPPPNTTRPDFVALANQALAGKVPNKWFTIPEADVSLGLDDPEGEYRADRYFGWDNEKPTRSVRVHSFSAQARPITNREYVEYLQNTGITVVPASWTDNQYGSQKPPTSNGVENGTNGANGYTNGVNGSTNAVKGKYVRTVYGAIELQYALDWPVIASYDELAGCAQWMGGRIPTAEETRSIYAYVERTKAKEVQNAHREMIPAVNGQMSNDGVEESPPSRGLANGSSSTAAASPASPHDLFIDLEGKNVGFKHWHPTPVVQNGNTLAGQGDFGGVWEWTSTVLEKYDGFEPMSSYPGYTAEFFDTKHNIALGGSWATHPRIAGRKTFVNWYQRNYPYPWAGARVVRDI